ncbi:MAG TPA: Rrf2 family transcriptional regulator [Bacteroidales bacterium]|nr:Rrf2 family transcriptional regulator [Bacteroidales bacterium]
MNFKKTTSYSLSILSFMAKNPEKRVSADYLNRMLGIPYQYLRQLLTSLSQAGFISGSRGRNGGFVLGRGPEKILLSEIVNSCEGAEVLQRCIMGYTSCQFNESCPMHEIWESARKNLVGVLGSTTLTDLIRSAEKSQKQNNKLTVN